MKKKKKKYDLTDLFVESLGRGVLRDTSVLSPLIREAVRFAIETHEVQQKQKRKGKDIPYITHPLVVGLLLAGAGASQNIIAAGILHDTIEDSAPGKKVDRAILAERFSPSIVSIVEDVSEPRRDLSWATRKRKALSHVRTMAGPSLWVKSADVISNVSELLDDYAESGEEVFSRFNAPKGPVIAHYRALLNALVARWEEPPFNKKENPLLSDLKTLAYDLKTLAGKGSA